jgi:signal transduction histidine kinase
MTEVDVTEILRKQAMVLQQRERERFALRAARERSDAWLRGFHRLSEVGMGPGVEPIREWAHLLVDALDFQLAGAYEIGAGSLRLIEGESPKSLGLEPPAVVALLAGRSGLWRQSDDAPSALAGALGLFSFVWEIVDGGAGKVLLVAGFESESAECRPGLGSEDLSYFHLLADHLSVLVRNKRLLRSYAETNDQLEASLRALRDAQAKLVVADRMSSLGTLAAGVAHEINNPLTYVIGNLDLVTDALESGARKRPERDDELRAMVDDARFGAEQVRKIVAGLRAFSRSDEEHRTRVDVRHVLQSALDLTANETRHRARVKTELGVVPLVDADEGRLAQVFINLLANAAQAIPEGRVDDNEIRVVTSTTPSGQALVEVHDSGCGIAPAIVDRIFAPFFTTKPVGFGTGLGLSICQGIIASLGGEITVESRPGKGTVFRVLLPAGDRHAAEAMVVSPSIPIVPARIGRARIAVVDDDLALARTLERMLAGHDVTVVHTGRAALDLLARSSFDLILCDVMMPAMTAVELYAAIPATCRARVVFMTGGAFTPATREFLARVPNACLDKPLDPQALRGVVQRCMP